MNQLHVRASVAGALFVGASAVVGYVAQSAQPTLMGVIGLLLATVIPAIALAMFGIETNRRIRASGLDPAAKGPLWGPSTTEDRRAGR